MRVTIVLIAVALLAFVASPALAGPGERGKDGATKTEAKSLEKRIQQLTRELKKLEKQLEKAKTDRAPAEKAASKAEQGRRERAAQHKRMAEARRRLAGLLAERGRSDQAAPPHAPRARPAPQALRAPKSAAHPQAQRRRGPAPTDRGPEWMGALRRIHQEHAKLATRLRVVEGKVERIAAAIQRLMGQRPEHAAAPRQAHGARAPKAQGRKARGQKARGRTAHARERGAKAAGRKARAGGASIEARLARLERAVRALMARERGAKRGRAMPRSPRWVRGEHGLRDGEHRATPRRGPGPSRMLPPDQREHRGPMQQGRGWSQHRESCPHCGN